MVHDQHETMLLLAQAQDAGPPGRSVLQGKGKEAGLFQQGVGQDQTLLGRDLAQVDERQRAGRGRLALLILICLRQHAFPCDFMRERTGLR